MRLLETVVPFRSVYFCWPNVPLLVAVAGQGLSLVIAFEIFVARTVTLTNSFGSINLLLSAEAELPLPIWL